MTQRLTKLLGRGTLYSLCGLATVFILANSYETAFGRTLPLVHAVNKIDLSFLRPDPSSLAGTILPQTDNKFEGNYGNPLQLKIAGGKVRIPVAAPIYHQPNWYARASTAHYIIVSPAKSGDIGNTIIYMVGSQTTFQNPAMLKTGDNLFIDTSHGWRYLYQIDEVVTLVDQSQKYILADGKVSKVYVVVHEQNANIIITASLITVENANQ